MFFFTKGKDRTSLNSLQVTLFAGRHSLFRQSTSIAQKILLLNQFHIIAGLNPLVKLLLLFVTR